MRLTKKLFKKNIKEFREIEKDLEDTFPFLSSLLIEEISKTILKHRIMLNTISILKGSGIHE